MLFAETPHTTSTSLLIRLQANDENAWRLLDRVYLPLVERQCAVAELSAADREDVVQQVAMKVHQKIGDFQRQRNGSFRKWLRTITANVLTDRQRNSPDVPSQELLERLASPSPEEDAAEKRLQYENVVAVAGSIFSEKWVRCFLGMTVHGITSDQLAGELDMSPGAVRKANYKVLRRLKEEFSDLLED